MQKKIVIFLIVILVSILVGMQHSLASHYYLKPFLAAYFGLISFFACGYFIIHNVWQNTYLIGILGGLSFFSLSLCHTYALEAKDYKNRQEVILFNLIGKGCPMDRSAKSVEVYGKDPDGNEHYLYTSHRVFDALRGRGFHITYLPSSKKIIEITSYTPQ